MEHWAGCVTLHILVSEHASLLVAVRLLFSLVHAKYSCLCALNTSNKLIGERYIMEHWASGVTLHILDSEHASLLVAMRLLFSLSRVRQSCLSLCSKYVR